jgi:hypothetical protein
VIVIDDDPAIRSAVRRMLERAGPADLHEHGLVLGATRVLAKPVSTQELVAAIHALLEEPGEPER